MDGMEKNKTMHGVEKNRTLHDVENITKTHDFETKTTDKTEQEKMDEDKDKLNFSRLRSDNSSVEAKRDLLQEHLSKVRRTRDETKVWFSAGATCDTPVPPLIPYSERGPSSLCQQPGPKVLELCYCLGTKESGQFQRLCGSCQATFIPERSNPAEPKGTPATPGTGETTTSNIILDLILKLKKKRELMSQEWTKMDFNKGRLSKC